MTSDEFKNFVFRLARQRQTGNYDIVLFNQCYVQAQLDFIRNVIGDIDSYENGIVPVGKTGAEITTAISDSVGPLVKSQTITLSGQQATKPADYFYRYNLEYTLSGIPQTIDVIPFSKRNYRLNSGIVPPSPVHPIGFNFNTYWEIWPTSVTTINCIYVRKPIPPKWAYTGSGDTIVYDPTNSQALEVPEQYHEKIALMVLQRMAASVVDTTKFQLAKAI